MMEGFVEPHLPGGSASPSLRGSARKAFEAKYTLLEDAARRLESVLRVWMALDPHADPAAASYHVTTVYFDTPDFAVYRKAAGFRTTKHRVRRYGDAPEVYLEWKSKRGQRVRKHRSAVGLEELARLGALPEGADWKGHWFAARVHANGLAPVCRVAYERLALCGDSETGPIRATFDRRLRGTPCPSLALDADGPATPLPMPGVVVEFKFTESMPLLFREAVAGFGLAPSTASKYRACIDALGLGPARTARHA